MEYKHTKLFKSFKEFLNESPIAYSGNHRSKKIKLGVVSSVVVEKYWKKLKIYKSERLSGIDAEDYQVFISPTEKIAMLGYFNQKDFVIISQLFFKTYTEINSSEYPNAIQTSEVATMEDYHGRGFGTSLYLTLLNNDFTLVSDYNQFDGARNLWRGLQGYDIKLDLMNVCDYDITKNHKIIHTDIDNLDKEWSEFPETSGECYLFIAYK